MTCREFIEFLMDYLDGVLPEAEHRRFEEHLVDCHECQTYLETYRETSAATTLVLGEPEDPVPADVPEDLIKAILDSRDPGRRS